MIVINIIGGLVIISALTIFFIKWLKAEKKLAKYGESILFKEEKNRDVDGVTHIGNDKNR